MASNLSILTFHDISPRQSVISITPEVFRKGIANLHEKGYRTLSLMVITDCLNRGRPFPDHSFLITFDDGYRSVYEKAFPVLQDYCMNATVFITVGETTKSGSGDRLLSQMGQTMLNWNEIREMHSYGFDFGAHTLTHPDLKSLPLEQAEHEISQSKTVIEDALGYPVSSFAYPFGRYNRQVYNIVKQLFSCSVSDKLGLITVRSDRYALERVDTFYLRTARSFNLITTGLFPWYIRARNIPRSIRRAFQG
jgi:peptidoglycan/xylan/chitin deacetylase (PgdA/CDA1 family)